MMNDSGNEQGQPSTTLLPSCHPSPAADRDPAFRMALAEEMQKNNREAVPHATATFATAAWHRS